MPPDGDLTWIWGFIPGSGWGWVLGVLTGDHVGGGPITPPDYVSGGPVTPPGGRLTQPIAPTPEPKK